MLRLVVEAQGAGRKRRQVDDRDRVIGGVAGDQLVHDVRDRNLMRHVADRNPRDQPVGAGVDHGDVGRSTVGHVDVRPAGIQRDPGRGGHGSEQTGDREQSNGMRHGNLDDLGWPMPSRHDAQAALRRPEKPSTGTPRPAASRWQFPGGRSPGSRVITDTRPSRSPGGLTRTPAHHLQLRGQPRLWSMPHRVPVTAKPQNYAAALRKASADTALRWSSRSAGVKRPAPARSNDPTLSGGTL